MEIERGNLEIIFRWIPFHTINWQESDLKKRHDCFSVNEALYMEQCYHVFADRSEDEWHNCYKYMVNNMRIETHYLSSVFQLVLAAAKKFLKCIDRDVFCRFEELLRWRETTLCLGQDIFVCAFLADYDLKWNFDRKYFSWNPVIKSDNSRVNAILERGVAENHFHLKGSSRIFETNWVSLMNRVQGWEHEFKKLKKYLQHKDSNGLPVWSTFLDMCQRAALYRVYLFSVCYQHDLKMNRLQFRLEKIIKYEDQSAVFSVEIQDCIDLMQYIFGATFINHVKKEELGTVLDYAVQKDVYDENRGCYHLLSGERRLLYDCFKACFSGKFTTFQQNIFYKYLRIRTEFRQEMIQTNKVCGFSNFRNYDDRKDLFIGKDSQYEEEFLKIAMGRHYEITNLKYLEMRITPKSSSKSFFQDLKKYQRIEEQVRIQGSEKNINAYFVVHFPKSKDNDDTDEFLSVRNDYCRKENKKRARSIVKVIESGNMFGCDIVGIDACASEIGCRPETFGQLFRYLRDRTFTVEASIGSKSLKKFKQMNITYHVGEDFLDIVDGLRAVDEAILFCGLERGSRIGHGLALGVSPDDYYNSKAFCVVLPKQDLLDNIVWSLCVAEEHGCRIDAELRSKLLSIFNRLFNEIYGVYYEEGDREDPRHTVLIDDYYQSWKLRGDDPELYKFGTEELKKKVENKGYEIETWNRFAFNDKIVGIDNLRYVKKYVLLNYYYAFNATVRKEGMKEENFKIERNYINLVKEIQYCMINKLINMGIAIETNPSSNCLIGTGRRYDKHPILRLNSRKLCRDASDQALSVSINTDDQGIFDTSLENEYALMAIALEKAKNKDGTKRYEIENIYEWLDYVRLMGLDQAFRNRQVKNNSYEEIAFMVKQKCFGKGFYECSHFWRG